MFILICVVGCLTVLLWRSEQKRSRLEKDINKLNEIAADEEYWIAKNCNIYFFEAYFKERDVESIAVYGAGYLGRAFIGVLEHSENVRIRYIIDQNKIENELSVYTVDENLPEVDMVIVTAIMEYENIRNLLCAKGMKNIVSIESIIWAN